MPETVQSYVDGEIDGVVMRPLTFYHDARGWLVELFRQDELVQDWWPMMTYVSQTLPDVTRGPHEHVDQTDGFAFIGPSDFKLVLWDIRPTQRDTRPSHGCYWSANRIQWQSGYHRVSCMHIAMWAAFRDWFSMLRIVSLRAKAKKNQSTRFDTRMLSQAGSRWIEGS